MTEQIVDLDPTPRTRQIQKMLPNGDLYWIDVDEEEIMRVKPEAATHGHQVSGAFTCTSCGLGFMAQYALAEHVTRDHKIDSGQRDMSFVQVPTGEIDQDGNEVLEERRVFEVPELATQSKVAQDAEAEREWQKKYLAQNEDMELLRTQNAELAQAMEDINAHLAELRAAALKEEAAATQAAVVPTTASSAPALKPRGRTKKGE